MASSNSPVIRPLGSIGRAITELFRQPQSRISGVDEASAFGPLQPFKPMGGDGAQPWVSQIQPGQNLVYTPRPRAKYDASQLREMSMYDLVRIIIENVEDQCSRMPINIRLRKLPGESGRDYAKRKADPAKLLAISTFIENPNAEQSRSQFARQFFDDMLVLDAASILVRRNLKGKVFDIRAIDGAQIVRYFDRWGATPQPPDPAYAQVWNAGQSGGNGLPWVDLTTDQLLYPMRNCKTYGLYGMSPLEQGLTMIQTGQLRLEFQKDYYTSGSVPDAMQIVPAGISMAKLEEAQKVLNAELSGVLSKRRQIRLITGFEDKAKDENIIFPKEALLKDEMDDYIIRVLCYCFGTSPQRLQRVMGMRSGQVNQESAEKEGLEPWLDWAVSSVWNPIIQKYLGFPEYEATYEEDSDVDPETQAKIDDLGIRNGSLLINESREARGRAPYTDVPEADQPMIVTATGPVPLSLDAQVEHAKNMFEATPKPEAKPAGGKSDKVEKRRAVIDPGHETPHRARARARLESALVKIFDRQREKAVHEAEKRIGKIRKSDDSKKIADEIFASIESEFQSLPAEARASLEQAALSGISDAWLQIEINDTGIIGSANHIAAEYAAKRAAELVGMKYNSAGELVPNPNAKWAISTTTRDRLREIIKNAFEDKTPFSELIDDIANADVFTERRAALIARTEVSRAQVQSNLDAWKKSGVVAKVKWLAVGPDPCPICIGNDGEIRKIGEPFSSGDEMPLAHPNCYCILQAVLD